jgi:hypothetical protein
MHMPRSTQGIGQNSNAYRHLVKCARITRNCGSSPYQYKKILRLAGRQRQLKAQVFNVKNYWIVRSDHIPNKLKVRFLRKQCCITNTLVLTSHALKPESLVIIVFVAVIWAGRACKSDANVRTRGSLMNTMEGLVIDPFSRCFRLRRRARGPAWAPHVAKPVLASTVDDWQLPR